MMNEVGLVVAAPCKTLVRISKSRNQVQSRIIEGNDSRVESVDDKFILNKERLPGDTRGGGGAHRMRWLLQKVFTSLWIR